MNYQKQAQDWLDANGVKMTIGKAEVQSCPRWEDSDSLKARRDNCPTCGGIHGYLYFVEMTHGELGVNYDRVRFPFWGSIHDKQNRKAPTPYDILACVALDIHCPETFADFCVEYGYDNDSRKAERVFHDCLKHAQKLRRFFGSWANLDTLAEIQ